MSARGAKVGKAGSLSVKPLDVLMPVEGMGVIAESIAARMPLHRLWLEADPEAWLAAQGPRIRAVALAGPHMAVDDAFIGKLPNLEIIASFGVGYDQIDAHSAARRGVIVTNTPGVLDDEVADTAIGLTIATVRRLPQAERFLREGAWLRGAFPLTASLRGRTLGVLGLGRIGKAIAKRAEAFGLAVVYNGRRPQARVPYRYYPSLIEMAKASDILIVSAPGGDATRNIVNMQVLDALGPDGVFVNVSRGSLVDESALIEALREGRILAAGLDVFENEPHVPKELVELDNAVLLPHVGSASVKTRYAMADCLVANLFAWGEGKPPLTPVPETPWRGQWGKSDSGGAQAREAPAGHEEGKVVTDRTSLIGGILAIMQSCWDLPADCNDGELFAYAEVLADRIEAGDGRDALYACLAEVQADNLEMPKSGAYKEIVDRSVALLTNSG
jgi:lactate dehydrogenase-like 2-hydroxyacid dehydrogenase